MAQNFSQNSELDRMKADAIKRARQMHLRAANFPPNVSEEREKESANTPKNTNQRAKVSRNGILEMIRV